MFCVSQYEPIHELFRAIGKKVYYFPIYGNIEQISNCYTDEFEIEIFDILTVKKNMNDFFFCGFFNGFLPILPIVFYAWANACN